MNINFDTEDELVTRFLAALGIPSAEQAAAAGQLGHLALRLYLEWALNERRFDRAGQWTEHLIAETEAAFNPEKEPDPTQLYLRYALPLPRAQFVARMLLARQTSQWRAKARQELRQKLEPHFAECSALVANGSRTEERDVILSRGAAEEFTVAYGQAYVWPDTPLQQPKRQNSFAAQVSLRLTAEVVAKVYPLL
jgi:hypothetical protein